MEEATELPKGAVFTLKVPLNREKTEFAIFHIKEMEEDVYQGARSLIDKKKDFDAVRMVVQTLRVGGDQIERVKGNFVAMNSLARMVLELIEPVEGELKKN